MPGPGSVANISISLLIRANRAIFARIDEFSHFFLDIGRLSTRSRTGSNRGLLVTQPMLTCPIMVHVPGSLPQKGSFKKVEQQKTASKKFKKFSAFLNF
jgi:hypothetical protein